MKIFIESSRRSVSIDWSDYALLRDNIQHFLEGGQPSARFRALHALEGAVDTGKAAVDAARLRGELLGACYGLRKLELRDGAISLRTRSLVTQCPTLPKRRGTTRAAAAGWSLPTGDSGGALLRHLQRLVATLLAVTETAVDGDRLTVRCAAAARAPWRDRALPRSSAGDAWSTAKSNLDASGAARAAAEKREQ